jgi:two-component system cell cycle sensor histidine kinase/response regulator CckA
MARTPSVADLLAERLRYEEGIARCSRALLAGSPRAIGEALEHLRAAAGASRVYLFENFVDPTDGPCSRQTHEACAPGIVAQIGNPTLQHLPLKGSFDPASEMLSQGKAFWGVTEKMPEPARTLLASQDVLSALIIPINVSGAWYGFIGFDDTEVPREWSREDMRLLETAAEMLGTHIGREHTLEVLARREAQLDAIFRTAPSGLGVVVDRVLTQVNTMLCRMTGYESAELIGRNTRMLYQTQEEYDRVASVQSRNIAEGGTGTMEARWIRRDGAMIDILLCSTPLVEGNLEDVVVFAALDISELRQAAREQQLMETRVQQVQRLESLGVLAGGIAHDFNNIFMVVLGNLDLLLEGEAIAAPTRDVLREIRAAARGGADLTAQLLSYAGRGFVRAEQVDLSAVIRGMTKMLEVSAGRKGHLSLRLAAGLPPVVMDSSQLRQVTMNLLTNASESIPAEGGEIILSTGSEMLETSDLATHLLGHELPPGRYVHVEVKDNGCGMDAETQNRMFDPFFTTKFTGRGLGLAAVHGIVRSSSGCIKVSSDAGRGTVIRVLFPAAGGLETDGKF